MRKHLAVMTLSAAVALPPLTYAQQQQQHKEQQQQQEQKQTQTGERQGARTGVQTDEQGEQVEREVTRGRVKEFTPGQAITIDVPMAIDKSYNLAQPEENQRVTVAEGLKVGDPVAVIEWEQNNVKFVRIVPQGAEAAMADGTFTPSATATGRVQQMTSDQISIVLQDGGTRTFNLHARTGPQVIVGHGVSSGDTVRILEGKEAGKPVVRIEKAEGAEGQASGTRSQGEGARQPQTDQNK